jgi:small nuclear ribonucleoprotein
MFKVVSAANLCMSGRPLDVLEASLGDVVTVRLKSGDTYVGELGGYDQHMNVVLGPAHEDDTAPGGPGEPARVRDTTIIRDNNVDSIHP